MVITTLQSGLLTQLLTPFMLRMLILYMSGGSYRRVLKSTSNDRFLRNFSLAILFTFRVFVRNLLMKYFFIFRFVGDVWQGVWTEASRLISQHTTYYSMMTIINYAHIPTSLLANTPLSQRKIINIMYFQLSGIPFKLLWTLYFTLLYNELYIKESNTSNNKNCSCEYK